jgi:hypothetical protein
MRQHGLTSRNDSASGTVEPEETFPPLSRFVGRLGRLRFGRLRLIFRMAILRFEAFAYEAPLSNSSDNECYRHPASAEGNKDRECPSIGQPVGGGEEHWRKP